MTPAARTSLWAIPWGMRNTWLPWQPANGSFTGHTWRPVALRDTSYQWVFFQLQKCVCAQCPCQLTMWNLFIYIYIYSVCAVHFFNWIFISNNLLCVCVRLFQEDDYEWGSQSILDALSSINSQQKRLALAAMRWRKTLQGRTDKEVQATPFLSAIFPTQHFRSPRLSTYTLIPSLGCVWWLDSDVKYRPGQRCRI